MPKHPITKKAHRFIISLTDDQYATIEAAAERAGVSQAEYIRRKIGVKP